MNDKLRAEIKDAADKLANQKPPTNDPHAIGDEFVLPIKTDITLSWLIVNFHVDDPTLAIVVPVADFPLLGVCDVMGEPPRVAHCGYSEFANIAQLPIANRVDYGLTEWAKNCRRVLGMLARGKTPKRTPERDGVELNPDYENHCADIAKCCAQLTG